MRERIKNLIKSPKVKTLIQTSCKLTLAFMIVAAEAVTSRCYVYWLHAPELPPSMRNKVSE